MIEVRMGQDQPGLHLHRWRSPILPEGPVVGSLQPSEALGVLQSRIGKCGKCTALLASLSQIFGSSAGPASPDLDVVKLEPDS